MNLSMIFFLGAMCIVVWNWIPDDIEWYISLPLGVALYLGVLWTLDSRYKVMNK